MVRWDLAQVLYPACSWPGHSLWATRARSTVLVTDGTCCSFNPADLGWSTGRAFALARGALHPRTKGSQLPPPFLSPPQIPILPLLANGRNGGWGLATHKISMKEIRLCPITHTLSLFYDCPLLESKPPSEELEKAGTGLPGCV